MSLESSGPRRVLGAFERWGETSRQWIAQQSQRFFSQPGRAGQLGSQSNGASGKRRLLATRRSRVVAAIVLGVFLLTCVAPTTLGVFQLYLPARSGLQHLKNAEEDLKTLGSHPFDVATITAAQNEFAAADADFTAADRLLGHIPGFVGKVPLAGAEVGGAQRVLPIAIEIAQAGEIGCQTLALVAPKLKNPLDTSAGQGLTADDVTAISQRFEQIKALFDQIIAQVGALQPSDLNLDPRLGPLVGTLRAQLPDIQQTVNDVEATLKVAPALLGIGTPANYLLEVLDSTELRPGGGFIGNNGFVTINGGRLGGITMQDVDLLDKNVKYGSDIIPIPDQYNWFKQLLLQPKWGFRDSNLDADFPTSAQNGEHLYQLEAGSGATPVQGVIAITPWLIQNALKITGPITMPEYNNDQITADNLISKIHYYQLTPGVTSGPDSQYDPQSGSSLRKRFSGLLFKYFLQAVKTKAAQDMSPFVKLLIDGIHSKDIQIYLDAAPAEALLVHRHLGATIEAPASGDSLFVVDANIIANKSNYVITYAESDQITLDDKGNAVHQTTLTYTWPKDPATLQETYPSQFSVGNAYHDYLRIYVPPGVALNTHQGHSSVYNNIWSAPSVGTAFNRQVWGSDFHLYYGTSTTITVTWTDPGAATHDASGWHYHYLLQKEAGVTFALDLKIALPQCAAGVTPANGLTVADAHTAVLKQQPFTGDLNLALDYRC
jgi:hypothetical protein